MIASTPTMHAAGALIALSAAGFASAATIIASEDFTVRRSTAGIESNIHPKQSAGSNADRYAMLRFDSTNFGAGVTSAVFNITANSDIITQFSIGTATFTLHAVKDGDAQDEAVVQSSYDPDAPGGLYVNNDTLINLSQVTTLGTFTAQAGETVNFSNANLLSFIQTDTNGIVTLVITRNTAAGTNSVFLDNGTITPPQLVVTIPEPASAGLLGLVGLMILRRRRG